MEFLSIHAMKLIIQIFGISLPPEPNPVSSKFVVLIFPSFMHGRKRSVLRYLPLPFHLSLLLSSTIKMLNVLRVFDGVAGFISTMQINAGFRTLRFVWLMYKNII